jgi:hypothetical protein
LPQWKKTSYNNENYEVFKYISNQNLVLYLWESLFNILCFPRQWRAPALPLARASATVKDWRALSAQTAMLNRQKNNCFYPKSFQI